MIYRIRNWLMATPVLLCAQAGAASLSDLQVSNGNQQARITLSFIGEPEYAVSGTETHRRAGYKTNRSDSGITAAV